jgi:hypothetical protein
MNQLDAYVTLTHWAKAGYLELPETPWPDVDPAAWCAVLAEYSTTLRIRTDAVGIMRAAAVGALLAIEQDLDIEVFAAQARELMLTAHEAELAAHADFN